MQRLFVWPPEDDADLPTQYVGIVIQWRPEGWLHAGVLFRSSIEETRVLDQFGHFDYRLKPPEDGQLCVLCAVDELLQPTVIEAFLRLWDRNRTTKIPYGYSSPVQAWFSPRGVMQLDARKTGLCCQTFVQAAYDYANQPLLDPASPPARADDGHWQQAFLDQIQSRLVFHELRVHFTRVQGEVGTALYRPLEVAGAALADALPCSYAEAQANGVELEPLIPPADTAGAVLMFSAPSTG